MKGMRIRILPGAEPVEVVKVEETQRNGEPCWVIHAAPVRIPLHGGGMQERSRYIVPKSYRGLEKVA